MPVISGIVETQKKSPLPETIYITINFPDVVFKWMRPRSVIPKSKKEFTIRDIVEIDSKLCVHLKDGRNLGAGGIPEGKDEIVRHSDRLMLMDESRPDDIKRAERIIEAAEIIRKGAERAMPPSKRPKAENIQRLFDESPGNKSDKWRAVADRVCKVALEQSKRPLTQRESDYQTPTQLKHLIKELIEPTANHSEIKQTLADNIQRYMNQKPTKRKKT